jgi:hypothetical protein
MKNVRNSFLPGGRSERPFRLPGSQWGAFTVGLVASALSVLTTGCGHSTDPSGDRPPQVVFTPAADSVTIDLDVEQIFWAEVRNASAEEISFRRGEQVVSTEDHYVYAAEKLGVDSLAARVVLPQREVEKHWRISVRLGDAQRPPDAQEVTVGHGPLPGSIEVRWQRPAPQITPRPLARYLIAISYDGPVTEQNWEEALPLDAVASVPGQVGYMRSYDDDDHPVLQAGQTFWLAVRVEDDAGAMSGVGDVRSLRLSAPYWLEGVVRDDLLAPLEHILVSYGCDTCKTLTAADGSYRLGPFRDLDKYVLKISDDGVGTPGFGAFFDFRTDSLGAQSPQPIDVVLIRNWPLDIGCGDAYPAGGFLEYFLTMTRTDTFTLRRPNRQLLKWTEYPVRMYIHEAMTTDGTFSLDSLTVEAAATWNARLGEPYFIEVQELGEAQIEVYFEPNEVNLYGIVTVEKPLFAKINDVIPTLMKVKIKQNVSIAHIQTMFEVILHELGHALCLGGHSRCSASVHLMNAEPFGIIDARWPESPINDDEAAAVRCIRNLPQGVSMHHYRYD